MAPTICDLYVSQCELFYAFQFFDKSFFQRFVQIVHSVIQAWTVFFSSIYQQGLIAVLSDVINKTNIIDLISMEIFYAEFVFAPVRLRELIIIVSILREKCHAAGLL